MRQVDGWYTYYLNLATQVATRSKDPRTQVGAVITDMRNNPISFGYNGFPSGVEETNQRWQPETKYQYVVHAEINAILNAAKMGVSTRKGRLFVTLAPCSKCALQIIQAGISEVIYDKGATTARLKERSEFNEDHQLAQVLFMEAGVGLYGL